MDLIEGILNKLLMLVHGLEAAIDILTSSRKWLTSALLFIFSGITIWLADISSVDDPFSALAVSVFVVSGVYFFYALTNFIRSKSKVGL